MMEYEQYENSVDTMIALPTHYGPFIVCLTIQWIFHGIHRFITQH